MWVATATEGLDHKLDSRGVPMAAFAVALSSLKRHLSCVVVEATVGAVWEGVPSA